MAKRFSDTEKWKKPLLRSLPTEYKLLWIYILDDCDHAGIWHVDEDIASLRIGKKISIEKAEELFSDQITSFDDGNKLDRKSSSNQIVRSVRIRRRRSDQENQRVRQRICRRYRTRTENAAAHL